MGQRLVVVGAVAAGTKAASRAKRLNPELEVTVITRERDVSYAGCGLPYFVGDIIKDRSELVVRSPQEFQEAQGIRVLTLHEVESIDPVAKQLTVKALSTGDNLTVAYDQLILATGSTPARPGLPGMDLPGVLQLHTVPAAEDLKARVTDGVRDAVVVGGGLIGLETAENLAHRGVRVTILEREDTILGTFDTEVSLWVAAYLREQGIGVETGQVVVSIAGDTKATGVITDSTTYPADVVIWATGVRPNSELAARAGAQIGPRRGIKVDDHMHTSLPDIWAAGDCTETVSVVLGDVAWVAMGSVANKTGRVAGTNAAGVGLSDTFSGIAGTCIMKVFGLAVGKTGLTEREAKARGMEYETVLVPSNDKAHYYPGHKTIFIKLLVERSTRRVVGAQVWGEGVVDKPLDVLATAMSLGGTVDQVAELDLAYAPPFSMAMPSVVLAANVSRNKLAGLLKGISSLELQSALDSDSVTVLDVRTEPEHMIRAIPGSVNIPLEELEARAGELPRDKPVVAVCRVGRRAYLASLSLAKMGFPDVSILDGGTDAYPYEML